jgi:hypothetical protein
MKVVQVSGHLKYLTMKYIVLQSMLLIQANDFYCAVMTQIMKLCHLYKTIYYAAVIKIVLNIVH